MNHRDINEAEWRNPDHWSCGISFSKKDTRTVVPKAIPAMGWTLNLGTPSGARWMIALLIGLPLFPIAIMALASLTAGAR